jgi:hypothetical protein
VNHATGRCRHKRAERLPRAHIAGYGALAPGARPVVMCASITRDATQEMSICDADVLVAERAYEQQRQRWTVPPFVAVGRARTHVRELVAGGMTVAQIARRADLGAATINRLIGSGRCGGARKPPSRRTAGRGVPMCSSP